MYIYSLNKYIRCSVFLFSERVTALYCSSRVFATWRELCKFPVDSQKFTDASTVSSDIFEDYKVYISSKLTFIIFFWFYIDRWVTLWLLHRGKKTSLKNG